MMVAGLLRFFRGNKVLKTGILLSIVTESKSNGLVGTR